MTLQLDRSPAVSAEWVDRYLAFLGEERQPPSFDALGSLLRANFRRVSFENVTSLLRRLAHPGQPVPAIDLEALLANWERNRGGGVCYEISGMFHTLLVALGYDATPVLAQISFPAGHQAVRVTYDGVPWLVDVGTGAPLFDPIPLDRVTEHYRAGLGFRARPGDEPNQWISDRRIDGEWSAFTRYTLGPPDEQLRQGAYQRHHTFGESWVVDKLRMVRCTEDTVYSVTGNELTTFTDAGKQVRTLTSMAEYRELAADLFDLPNLPLAEAHAARPQFVPVDELPVAGSQGPETRMVR